MARALLMHFTGTVQDTRLRMELVLTWMQQTQVSFMSLIVIALGAGEHF